MTLVYQCRHCGGEIGKINPNMIDIEKIGWHVLSEEEKLKLLQYHPESSVTIHTICEDCQKVFDQHPLYHELDHFKQ